MFFILWCSNAISTNNKCIKLKTEVYENNSSDSSNYLKIFQVSYSFKVDEAKIGHECILIITAEVDVDFI